MVADRLPGPLREVAEHLARLPGLGPKSALRAALALLKLPREQAEAVGRSVLTLRERLCLCSTCASLATPTRPGAIRPCDAMPVMPVNCSNDSTS